MKKRMLFAALGLGTAGFLLLAGCGGVMEYAAGREMLHENTAEKLTSDAPMEPAEVPPPSNPAERGEPYGEPVHIRTNGGWDRFAYPLAVCLTSADELTRYYDAFSDYYDLSRHAKVYADTTIGWLDAVDGYDADWFGTHDLLMILVEAPSGSIRYQLKIEPDGGENFLRVTEQCPECFTDDMAEWHLMLPVSKGWRPDRIVCLGKEIEGGFHDASQAAELVRAPERVDPARAKVLSVSEDGVKVELCDPVWISRLGDRYTLPPILSDGTVLTTCKAGDGLLVTFDLSGAPSIHSPWGYEKAVGAAKIS